MIIRTIAFLTIVMLLFTMCDKQPPLTNNTPKPDHLPAITTSGENTFGFRINGKVWLPEIHFNLGGSYPIKTEYFNGKFRIIAKKKPGSSAPDINQTFGVYVESELSDSMVLDYPYSQYTTEMYGAWSQFSDLNTGCSYRTDSIHTGYIKFLRFDSTAKIVSGIFELTFVEAGCDTLKITDGRFDLKY